MRKLTIKREKSFVGCIMKMQVYIEDANSNDLTMTVDVDNGDEPLQLNCRKIGELKNGEEATFEISDDAAKVFVIADKISKSYCNDCYQIPQGREDISLSGKNKFNPAAGNAFRFNGNEGRVATIGRQRGMKRGLLVLIASVLIGFLIGYGVTASIFAIMDGQERVFEADGMSITLNKGFKEQSISGYDAIFTSKNVEIVALKTTFESFGTSHLTAAEFALTVTMNNDDLNCDVIDKDGVGYYTFISTASDNLSYAYYVYTYKTDIEYWQIYFAVKESKADKYADDIANWADSVKFN